MLSKSMGINLVKRHSRVYFSIFLVYEHTVPTFPGFIGGTCSKSCNSLPWNLKKIPQYKGLFHPIQESIQGCISHTFDGLAASRMQFCSRDSESIFTFWISVSIA